MLTFSAVDKETIKRLWSVPAWALLWPAVLYVLTAILDRYHLSIWRSSEAAQNLLLALLFLVNPAVGVAIFVAVLILWRHGLKDLKDHNLHRAMWIACLNLAVPVLLIVSYVLCCFTR